MSSNPILFYKDHQSSLPILSRMISFFCTPASSVPSECMFSGGGTLISKKRTRLNPDKAEDLLFLDKNQS